MSLTSGQFGALGLQVSVPPGVRQIDVDAAYDSASRVKKAAHQMALAAAELKRVVGQATVDQKYEREHSRSLAVGQATLRDALRQTFRECYQEYAEAVAEATNL